MSSPPENAEHRLIAARGRLRCAALNQPPAPEATIDLAIDGLIAAVEARCIARIEHAPVEAALGDDAKQAAIALIRQEPP